MHGLEHTRNIRTIYFISVQLCCAKALHMNTTLNSVLRYYASSDPFGSHEWAVANFSYDLMDDYFERLTDTYSQLFCITDHTVLFRLYESTLIPVFLDAFKDQYYVNANPFPCTEIL